MRRAENAVVSAPDLEREPPRKGDDCRRGAHRLRPSVYGPEDTEAHKQRRIGYGSVEGIHTQHAHYEVHSGRHHQARGHEALDVGAVGQETVDEFANCIRPVQTGPDDTKLGGVEQARVDERLLHHTHRQAAHIIKCVAECARYERLDAFFLINLVNLFGSDLHRRRFAHTEKIQKSHIVLKCMKSFFGKPAYQEFGTVGLDHRDALVDILLVHIAGIGGHECRVIVVAVTAAEACPYGIHPNLGALVENLLAGIFKRSVVGLPAYLVCQRNHSLLEIRVEKFDAGRPLDVHDGHIHHIVLVCSFVGGHHLDGLLALDEYLVGHAEFFGYGEHLVVELVALVHVSCAGCR